MQLAPTTPGLSIAAAKTSTTPSAASGSVSETGIVSGVRTVAVTEQATALQLCSDDKTSQLRWMQSMMEAQLKADSERRARDDKQREIERGKEIETKLLADKYDRQRDKFENLLERSCKKAEVGERKFADLQEAKDAAPSAIRDLMVTIEKMIVALAKANPEQRDAIAYDHQPNILLSIGRALKVCAFICLPLLLAASPLLRKRRFFLHIVATLGARRT